MRRLLTALLTVLCFTPAVMAGEPAAACPIDGELVHWIADYCMATLETDDEIAAGDCIAAELAKDRADECAAKGRYKQALCKLARVRGATAAALDQCLADRDFAGSTVRDGGVGGRRVPADR